MQIFITVIPETGATRELSIRRRSKECESRVPSVGQYGVRADSGRNRGLRAQRLERHAEECVGMPVIGDRGVFDISFTIYHNGVRW